MSDKRGVQPREGGPYSLYCYDCGEWVPNTANHEMAKEGCFSHSHWCKPKEEKRVREWISRKQDGEWEDICPNCTP